MAADYKATHHLDVPLPGDSVVTIEISPDEPEAPEREDGHGQPLLAGDADLIPPARARIRRLDVIYTTKYRPADDGIYVPVPSWRQYSMEQSLFAGADEQARILRNLLALRYIVEIQDSNRLDWSNFALTAGSDETDGTGLYVAFQAASTPELRQYAVIGNSTWWQQQIHPVDRYVQLQADIEAAAFQATEASLQPARDAAFAQSNENWWALGERVHRTGTLEAHLTPDRWAVRWNSGTHFHECDPTDEERFKVVRGENPATERVDAHLCGIGFDQGCDLELWVTPQIHNLFVQWIDVYEWASLFSGGLLFFAQQRQWRDALPWDPLPYKTTEIGNLGNDEAMSEFISTRQNYAAMLLAGTSQNHIGGLFTMLLVMRINGGWFWFRGRFYAGELAGIQRRADGEELFIYHSIDEFPPVEIFDSGKLSTQEVSPDFGFLVPGHLGFHP